MFALPFNYGSMCVILLDPDSSNELRFENLFCINRKGAVVWRAHLPGSPDSFISAFESEDGIVANTWSGFHIVIDKDTGKEKIRQFTK